MAVLFWVKYVLCIVTLVLNCRKETVESSGNIYALPCHIYLMLRKRMHYSLA